ncbi:unnamed protein product [Gadus morhua 'NCC']
MAMSGLLGNDRDVSRLKLLLSDRAQQGSFCLTFDFRVAGEDVGTLRVLLDAGRLRRVGAGLQPRPGLADGAAHRGPGRRRRRSRSSLKPSAGVVWAGRSGWTTWS